MKWVYKICTTNILSNLENTLWIFSDNINAINEIQNLTNYDDDNDNYYSDVVPAEGRPMRASLSSFIVNGKPFEEEKQCNPVYCRGPSGSQPCAP